MGKALRRIGWAGLLMGLAACGQASSLQIQSAGTVDSSAAGETVVAGGSQAMARVAFDPDAYTADIIDAELARMMLRPCHTTESEIIDDTAYVLCTGANGQPLRVEMGYPDGPMSRYWFQDDGTFYSQEDSFFDGNFTRKVLVGDGKTIVFSNSQGEWDSVEDAREWQDTADMASMAITTVRSELDRGQAVSSDAPQQDVVGTMPVGIVKLARTGGDFNHRWATLVVPQPSTAVSAEGGAMRWYDLHLATMVALTADQFCGNPSARGAYFHYEADGGSVYMGQYFIPCNTAKDLMATFGQDRHAWVVMEEGDLGGDAVDQWVPALADAMMPQFRRQVVDMLTPECSSGLCPGDRI